MKDGWVRWSQWTDAGMVGHGQIPVKDVQKNLQEFEKQARDVLKKSGADHVLYGVKLYDNDHKLDEVRFYMIAMSDEQFEKDVASKPGVQVYALHAMKTEEQKVASVVDFIIDVGANETTTGQWIVYYDEIESDSGLPFATVEWLKKHHTEIKDSINARAEALSETWDANNARGDVVGFDINLCGAYCPNLEREGAFEQ